MKSIKDCRYSAFISYAHEDDVAEDGWVGKFSDLLKNKLQNRLGRAGLGQLPPVHLSQRNGPVLGSLAEDLRANVADAFAMIIVVHNRYVQSDWCLKELEYFHDSFGVDGLKQRLYVVAMSDGAMQAVTAKPAWQQLALPDQLWIPFFRADDPDTPARVRLDNNELSERFETQLRKLLDELERSIKDDARRPPRRSPDPPAAFAPLRGGSAPQPLVAPIVAAASTACVHVLFASRQSVWPESVHLVAERLAALGPVVGAVTAESLIDDCPEFATADWLVLPTGDAAEHRQNFSRKLRDTWLSQGKPVDRLVWLDLRADTNPANQADLQREVGATLLTPGELFDRFAPKQECDAAAAHGGSAAERINIYIESNQHDVDLWEDLGARIQVKWDELLAGHRDEGIPSLTLRTRGLPLLDLDEGERLDDADGVVLLWGKKPGESLRAQINIVERMLPANPPPGIVAYLIPQRPDPEKVVEASYWKVLRFKDADSSDIDIVPTEAERLHKFLKAIFNRASKRAQLAQRH